MASPSGTPVWRSGTPDQVAELERSWSIFVEREVQAAVRTIPWLVGMLGFSYLALHLTVTGGYLLWLYRFRPAAFPFIRNTLLLATGITMIGYVTYPTAPPRLAGIGIVDTVSNGHVDLNSGLVHSLYNPFAAVPSMHFGYALVIGVSAVVLRRHSVACDRCALPDLHPVRHRRDGQSLPVRRAGWCGGRADRGADRPLAHPRRVDGESVTRAGAATVGLTAGRVACGFRRDPHGVPPSLVRTCAVRNQ